jgi:hypothetical protein
MSLLCPIKIKSIYVWIDGMPTITNQLIRSEKKGIMCTIEFDRSLKLFEICKIELINCNMLNKFIVDTRTISLSFEKRDNCVVIRNGPDWPSGSLIKADVTIKYNENDYILCSNTEKIQNVY